ncbi:MAG: thioredoxin family protein [Bacteroidota bacterium]
MHTLFKYVGFFLGMGIFMLTAQAAEINFIYDNFEEAATKAKEERKLIFVDAFAVWCGPCKMMDRNTFHNSQVAEFFNDNFINLKIDVEKGQGPAFSEKYDVTAMPTLLFINYKGELIKRDLGYKSPRDLMRLAKSANSPENNQDQFELAYLEGSNDPEILFNYAINQSKRGENFAEAATKYFNTQAEKSLLKEERNWQAIQLLTTDFKSREFTFLLEKMSKFSKKYGDKAVQDKVTSVLEGVVRTAAKENAEADYKLAYSAAKEYIDDNGLSAQRLKMLYAETAAEWDIYGQQAAYYFQNYMVTSPKELSKAAWLFYKNIDDPQMLAKAIGWAKQSVAIDNEYYNNKALAYLLYKSGKYQEARKAAYKTLKIAELRDLDLSEMRDLLSKIEEG